MKIFPLFSVPFAITELPQPTALNEELHALFLSREVDGESWRNPTPSMTISQGLFESRFDLFAWPERCIQQLHEFCMRALLQMVGDLNGYSFDELRQFELRSDAWFHITRRGGRFTAHNHPMASWSGVYCVSAGRSDSGAADSGVLHFQNPHQQAGMFVDPGNNRLRPDYSLQGRNLTLAAGQLVLFPSWLYHEVFPFQGEGERITVAFNSWFRRRGAA